MLFFQYYLDVAGDLRRRRAFGVDGNLEAVASPREFERVLLVSRMLGAGPVVVKKRLDAAISGPLIQEQSRLF